MPLTVNMTLNMLLLTSFYLKYAVKIKILNTVVFVYLFASLYYFILFISLFHVPKNSLHYCNVITESGQHCNVRMYKKLINQIENNPSFVSSRSTAPCRAY